MQDHENVARAAVDRVECQEDDKIDSNIDKIGSTLDACLPTPSSTFYARNRRPQAGIILRSCFYRLYAGHTAEKYENIY